MSPAEPPAGLPGLDPAWSRTVGVLDADGVRRSWHVLDSDPSASPDRLTLLCVHGNPTWSYLWRRLVAAAAPSWRVIAPDQLGMGYSDRLESPRTLAQRVADLGDLTAALGLTGPVVTVAHDWGGIISLGWALAHRDQMRGVVLANTAVHQPEDSTPPALIRLAHLSLLRESVCVRTPVFVQAATLLSRPALPRDVRAAFAAPYRTSSRRRSVGDFVADIPFADGDPSRPALDRIAEGVPELDVAALLLWGPRDPVFGEQYLRDLLSRLPQADVHRYVGASHLLPEDAPRYAEDVVTWVRDLSSSHPTQPVAAGSPVWQAMTDRARVTPDDVAVAEVGGARVTWRQLDERVRAVAAGLVASGVAPGDRVALLVPPSIDLTVAVYAVWRAGATIVVADKGLGVLGMGRALRSVEVDHVIGTTQGLVAASAMRLPGTRFLAGAAAPTTRRVLRAAPLVPPSTSPSPAARGDEHAVEGTTGAAGLPDVPDAAEAAVVFTSGATGPAKGVVYRHHQLRAQIDVVGATYGLSAEDRIVAAFAPFALYGPALGVGSAVPATDVTAPGTLTAVALADASRAIGATVVFASPAALRNVVATAADLTDRSALAGVRLLMSAGAPVPAPLLRSVLELMPAASAHTPYGMTEVLPVTDVSLEQIEVAGAGNGVCVGSPLAGAEVRVSPLDRLGRADGGLTGEPGVTGEICVRAAHAKDRYDGLWATERASGRNLGWHRTGDVGHLDDEGRLWVEGRLPHVVTSPLRPVTPVGLEQRVEALPGVAAAAVVGVGPAGAQQVVVVVVPAPPAGRRSSAASGRRPPRRVRPVADLALTDAVRNTADVPIAAVLRIRRLPVDIRHASKVDRSAVAAWAEKVLAGRS